MSIPPLPDIVGALIARYRSFTEITDLTALRISNRLQSDWFPNGDVRPAIWINGPIGSPRADVQAGIQRSRFDVFFYGANQFEAMRLWRIAHPCICPDQARSSAYWVGQTIVRNAFHEGGPSRADDGEAKHPRVLATYVYEWSGR